jgi:AcrR family transcriptional regulator
MGLAGRRRRDGTRQEDATTLAAMDGRATRWAAHNDAQRERIIAAAISLYDAGNAAPSLQEIGAQAGLARSVLYRQFEDRRDLDRAVRSEVLAQLWEQLAPHLAFSGPPQEALRTTLQLYVDWAASHPRLHHLVDLDLDESGPLQHGLDQISAAVVDLLVSWFRAVGAEVSEADIVATDPLAHGVVGLVHATVRRWVDQGCAVPKASHLVDLMAEAVWAMVEARAKAYGITVDAALLERLAAGDEPS